MQTNQSDTQQLRHLEQVTTMGPKLATQPFERNQGTFLDNVIGVRQKEQKNRVKKVEVCG